MLTDKTAGGCDEVGLIIAGIALALFYGIYVSLVKKKNNLKEAAAGIDVQLKKRYDLIPNLLKAAAKYMEHEKDVFMKVTELREKAMNAAGYEERFKAEQQLSEAMHGFRLTAENYPELKSDAAMSSAMQAMGETEEHIAAHGVFTIQLSKTIRTGWRYFRPLWLRR